MPFLQRRSSAAPFQPHRLAMHRDRTFANRDTQIIRGDSMASALGAPGCHGHCGPRSDTTRCCVFAVVIVDTRVTGWSIESTWYQFMTKRGSRHRAIRMRSAHHDPLAGFELVEGIDSVPAESMKSPQSVSRSSPPLRPVETTLALLLSHSSPWSLRYVCVWSRSSGKSLSALSGSTRL